jgi:hypothetical protein
VTSETTFNTKVMKISDSLGNLYTHTMFKKKSYDMKEDAVASIGEMSVSGAVKHHHHHRSSSKPDLHHQDRLQSEDEDDDDDQSVTSERSEDSISTKSSHVVMSRRQSGGRQESSRARSVRHYNFPRQQLFPAEIMMRYIAKDGSK